MDNDEFKEKENNKKTGSSTISATGKVALKQAVKKLPLKAKIIIAIILICVFFLLIVVVLSIGSMMFFSFDSSASNGSSGISYYNTNSVENFWWPIGSSDITEIDGEEYALGNPSSTIITSEYLPSRTLTDANGNSYTEAHKGIDIGSETGNDYIIAVAKATVYSIHNNCDNNGYYQNQCGGEWGNYVILEHANSVYTIYAHLAPNSITVNIGDVVEQGQVIGRMGNSGSSIGAHLHFQIENGGRSSDFAVDPLNYISDSKPRPETVMNDTNYGESELFSMLQSWEGTGPTDGDCYIVYDDKYGNLTVGHGVTLKNHSQRFEERQVDVSNLSTGSKIKKNIVDNIEIEIVNEKRNNIIKMLENNDISIEEYQIDALVIRSYNTGNVNNFPENYKQYGNTEALYDNYMSKPITSDGKVSSGLARRRQAEWNLFHKGIYEHNS